MSPLLLLFVTLFLLDSTLANQTLTDGHPQFTVYRVTPQDETQLAYVSRIYDAQAELDLDFWTEPSSEFGGN